jgi:hypothetical protein
MLYRYPENLKYLNGLATITWYLAAPETNSRLHLKVATIECFPLVPRHTRVPAHDLRDQGVKHLGCVKQPLMDC